MVHLHLLQGLDCLGWDAERYKAYYMINGKMVMLTSICGNQKLKAFVLLCWRVVGDNERDGVMA